MHFQAKRSCIKEPNSCRRVFPGYSRERALARHLSNVVPRYFFGEGGKGGGIHTVCLFQFRLPIGNVTMIVLRFGFEDPFARHRCSTALDSFNNYGVKHLIFFFGKGVGIMLTARGRLACRTVEVEAFPLRSEIAARTSSCKNAMVMHSAIQGCDRRGSW